MLHVFPYYSNYLDLTRLELHALIAVGSHRPLRTWAFIGSGPLPLTSLSVWKLLGCGPDQGVSCINVDRDPDAVRLSSELCRSLGLANEEVSNQHANIGKEEIQLSQFDVVHIAALVGNTSCEKELIIADVVKSMKAGAMLVLRTAHSLRSLLYPVSSG